MALDRYVETVLRGEDVTRAFGQLVLHLRNCIACREDTEGLLARSGGSDRPQRGKSVRSRNPRRGGPEKVVNPYFRDSSLNRFASLRAVCASGLSAGSGSCQATAASS